jgi:hypothetical protein
MTRRASTRRTGHGNASAALSLRDRLPPLFAPFSVAGAHVEIAFGRDCAAGWLAADQRCTLISLSHTAPLTTTRLPRLLEHGSATWGPLCGASQLAPRPATFDPPPERRPAVNHHSGVIVPVGRGGNRWWRTPGLLSSSAVKTRRRLSSAAWLLEPYTRWPSAPGAETRFFNQTLMVVQRREWPESGHSRVMRGSPKCGSGGRREQIVHNCRRTVNR